jgi:hypothetical protein
VAILNSKIFAISKQGNFYQGEIKDKGEIKIEK